MANTEIQLQDSEAVRDCDDTVKVVGILTGNVEYINGRSHI
ncbi:MAG TPA: hypothetical protein VIF82_17945 [Burkholderiaceae bacterium]